MRKNYFILCALGVLFCACSKNNLTMTVVEPAPVHLAADVKNVGVLNRSLPDDKTNKTLDDIDKILSAEGKNLDKEGADAAVDRLKTELGYGDRFSEVKLLPAEGLQNPGMGIMPTPLDWGTLKSMAEANNLDAIFVLSFYDTESQVDVKITEGKLSTPLGDVPAIEQQATVNTLIRMGWRIYDVKNQYMADEYHQHNEVVSSGRGLTPIQAVKAIVGRKEAVIQSSGNMGKQYAFRVFPYKIRVTREYFVKGTNNFKIAKRRAQTGDWNGAADLWLKETENAKMKVAGRAHYNMAIINEINGNLDEAIEWASVAYTDYKNKDALDYLKVLKRRKVKNAQLQQQTGQ